MAILNPRKWRIKGIRHLVILLTFIGTVFVSAMRVNLSVTIGSMVRKSDGGNAAEASNNVNVSHLVIDERLEGMAQTELFDWDHRTQSFIIASFYYGYAASVMIAGLFVHYLGMRWFTGLSMFSCSLLALLTPTTARWGAEFLIALRVAQGVSQGVIFPLANKVVSDWVPIMERSRAFSFLTASVSVGSILGMSLSGFLISSGGWPSVFYTTGALGCFWFVLWFAVVYNTPSQHPYISEDEKNFIISHQEKNNQEDKTHAVPWLAILTSAPVWAYCLATAGNLIGFFVIMIEMPIYLFSVLHFDVKTAGVLSAVPFVLRILCSYIGGVFADLLRRNSSLSINTIRKLFNSIGFFGSALALLTVALVGSRVYVIVTLLCVSCGISAMSFSGCMIAAVDMTPRYSSTLAGMSFTLGNIGGALIPYVISEVTKTGQTTENWSVFFLIVSAILVVTGLLFIAFGSATLQPWNAGNDSPNHTASSDSDQCESKNLKKATVKIQNDET